MNSFFQDYFILRAEIDSDCQRLSEIHSKSMVCAPGCSSCCMDFSVFPVEFYAIASETAGMEITSTGSPGPGQCVFLADDHCSVYDSRPIICRTHGLPLLAMGDDGWELSHCELNFTGKAPDFTEANTIPHDRYNSRLFLLNREFIQSFKDKKYSESDLIAIRDLKPGIF